MNLCDFRMWTHVRTLPHTASNIQRNRPHTLNSYVGVWVDSISSRLNTTPSVSAAPARVRQARTILIEIEIYMASNKICESRLDGYSINSVSFTWVLGFADIDALTWGREHRNTQWMVFLCWLFSMVWFVRPSVDNIN